MKTIFVAQALLFGASVASPHLARRQFGPYPYTEVVPVNGPQAGTPPWLPKIGQKIQVILDRRVVKLDPDEPLVPGNADIFDVDLFDTPKETFDVLHAKGKRVLCYFSGGGSESWRPDYKGIKKSDMGDDMPKWPGEKYLNLRSPTVWKFMQNRVKMAYNKGCDAIDPDNVDPFNDDFGRGGGFKPPLVEQDSIDFMRKLSAEARRYGMSIGLKNAEQLLPNVTDIIDFAVNEECTTYELGCSQYEPFLKAGKPVFHFEYVKVSKTRGGGPPNLQSVYPQWANLSSADIQSYYCLRNSFGNNDFVKPEIGALFSTAIKAMDLGGWVMYCDGTYAETPTSQTTSIPGERPVESSRGQGGRGGQAASGQAGEEKSSGFFGSLGSLWPWSRQPATTGGAE